MSVCICVCECVCVGRSVYSLVSDVVYVCLENGSILLSSGSLGSNLGSQTW